MPERVDLVVIGSGTAGSNVATRCRRAGWSVVMVDELPFGGTCALRGCDPKKVLVGAAAALDGVRRLSGRGLRADGAAVDWPGLMRFKRSFTEPVPERRERELSRAGIRLLRGHARFTAATELRVADHTFAARRVLIATGAHPVRLGIEGQDLLASSDVFLEIERLPERIAFVGGGFVSFEFAHLAARAGARVTILHRGSRPLMGFDPDLVSMLVERTRSLGIDVQLDAPVHRVTRSPGGFTVQAEARGAPLRVEVDLVVHGAGRAPNLEGLDLEVAGIAFGADGVTVDEHLRSITNPAVYAAGDSADTAAAALTPVAGIEGRVVAENLLQGDHASPDYRGVSTVVFTIPTLAAVGLLEEHARAQGLAFRTHHEKTGGWASSRRVGEDASGFKVLIDEASDQILGAHLLGPGAEEQINVFALAIRAGMTAARLADAPFAYPTHGSDVRYML